ncbi:polyketide antibiotic transporter [Blastococcus sp. CT_GayMR19]|uniref:polyketide antibiotic transporter n=1 Tax=Blastococcus sp. CT_GayMR19 TaxID=2559608 RepID=UPI00107325E8|nr:polyketide antibiotic transporter [Blastococcus sp. CT_GayMR19]TFV79345.1 polyketide antibiotic transporter [Blastococcus sp. CT_GayMR19]
MTALVAVQYRGLAGALGADSLAALAENPAIRTLFGPPVGLDTAGGFTVWRTGTVLAVLVGIWAASTATRLTRGDEEAGRWDLLLAGRLRLPSLVARVLVVLLGASAVVGAAGGLGLVVAGAPVSGSVLFTACLAGTGMVGSALGVLCAQLFADRRSASGVAVAVLLAGLLARMVSDGVPALAWLAWFTPFGLLGRAAPFAEDRWLPLLVLAVLVTAVAVLAVALATGRDVGHGRLAGRDRRTAPSRLLTSLPGLAVHRTGRPLAGWATGAMAYFLLIGLLATTMTEFLRDNPAFADLAAQAGFAQLVSVEGYVSALYTLLAVVIGAFTASRVAATAADETAGRLALLYSRPVSRARWAATEAAAVTLAAVGLAAATGLAAWAGTAWVDAGLGLGDAVTGALSVLPVALLCLGAALAALGWAPAAVLAIGVLPAVGGYLLIVFADTFGWPRAVRWFSPFAHLNDVPAEPWNVAGGIGMLAVAVALATAGCLGYARRDLAG